MKIRINYILPLATVMLVAGGCASTQPAPEAAPEPKVTEAQPAPAPAPAPEPAAQPAPSTMSYNVVRGDHLWGISSKPSIYGNPYQWPLIFKANRDKIQDADLIEPGWVLTVEADPSQSDIDAAVLHAKTRGTWQLGVSEQSDTDYLNGSPTRVTSR